MQINTIPQDFIINMSKEGQGNFESNFLLHGLIIKNDTDKPITLKHIDMELYANKNSVKQLTYRDQALVQILSHFVNECTWLGKGFGAQLFLGEEGFFNPEMFSQSLTLLPNQETGIFNEYFIIVSQKKVDSLTIHVHYELDGLELKQECTVQVVHYENKNKYIFPLKGCISTCGNFNSLFDHRQHFSMEFAIDMAQYNVDQKLIFKENMQNTDYVVWGKDVLAIADGVVIECYNDMPFTTSWVWEERLPYFKQYGLAAQFGNYVILQHINGESSFYGHMIEKSVTVKKGDVLKQGQIIGKVGSTGLSNCPHLHFQLMNKPDILAGRGLPCSFINISDVTGDQIDRIMDDNVIVHTF